MSGTARVSVVSNPDVRYPEATGDGSTGSAGGLDDNGSAIDGMIERALRLAGSAGEPGRPLLAEWVSPGQRVFVLPNLVMHRRIDRGETVPGFLSKCTNGSVVRPLLAHAVEATGDSRLVNLGSAPLQACDYAATARQAGFTNGSSEDVSGASTDLRPVDLRGVATVWSKYGSLLERQVRDVPTVEVDLGPLSYLDELYARNTSVDFRVGDYAPGETMSYLDLARKARLCPILP